MFSVKTTTLKFPLDSNFARVSILLNAVTEILDGDLGAADEERFNQHYETLRGMVKTVLLALFTGGFNPTMLDSADNKRMMDSIEQDIKIFRGELAFENADRSLFIH